jgi:hypothetical protein
MNSLHQLATSIDAMKYEAREPSRVFVARRGVHELTALILTAEQVRELVERMLHVGPAARRQPAVRRRDAARRTPAAGRYRMGSME